jgi:hypothetical protein
MLAALTPLQSPDGCEPLVVCWISPPANLKDLLQIREPHVLPMHLHYTQMLQILQPQLS